MPEEKLMKKVFIPVCAIILAAAMVYGQSAGSPPVASQRALIDQYCIGCHNDKTKSGSLDLTSLDLTHVEQGAPQWEKVVRKLRSGMMPPAGIKRPDPATVKTFVTSLESSLDQI